MLTRLLLLFTVIVWGLTFVATKMLLPYLNPAELLGLRMMIGLPILVSVIVLKGIRFEFTGREYLQLGIGSAIISIIPLLGVLIGFMVMFCVVPIAWFASVVMLFYYGVQAYKGRRFAIPGLTSFLQDQGWL